MPRMRLCALPLLLLLLPPLLDAFGAAYPGSFYGMLLRLGQARDRKLPRTAPAPSRLWAYRDPSLSGGDSVYRRATEEERVAQKHRRISVVHKPARLRYNSKHEAGSDTDTTKSPEVFLLAENTSAFLPRTANDTANDLKTSEKNISEFTISQASTSNSHILQFDPDMNDVHHDGSLENFIALQKPSSEETTTPPAKTETLAIDDTGSPMSLGAREQMATKSNSEQSYSQDDGMHSSIFSYFPGLPKRAAAKTNAAQKWFSNAQVLSKFPTDSLKNENEKSENRKFANQNVQFEPTYPTFHPLRPTMSPADVRKRNEFYDKFAKHQLLLDEQSSNGGQDFKIKTDSVTEGNTNEWHLNGIQVKEVPLQFHDGDNHYGSKNESYQFNKGTEEKESMSGMEQEENKYDHSGLFQVSDADDYEQLLYLQQLKENQKHLIDSKNKVFPSLYTGSDGKQMFNGANESSVQRRQNLDIPQSFINFDPIKIPVDAEKAVSAGTGGVTGPPDVSTRQGSWLQHQQEMAALQRDPLQQLVLQRQRIALQHLQRNVKPRDDAQQPIKPFFSASQYRSSDAGHRTGGMQRAPNNLVRPSPSHSECGGEYTFELDPLNFAQHPRERAFSMSFETPGYGTREPYSPGLTCLWTVQIGPSCRYGMLVYSLQPSFIRRSHACSQDHLDVLYNGDRVSRYCGPLSRQQRVSGAQIWSTSSPKNLTLLFESSPSRRRGSIDPNNWGVAIDVAAYCWGYSEAFKAQLSFLKKNKIQSAVTSMTTAATTQVSDDKQETIVPTSATALPEVLNLRDSSYNADVADIEASSAEMTTAPDPELETIRNTMTAFPSTDVVTEPTTPASALEEITPIEKVNPGSVGPGETTLSTSTDVMQTATTEAEVGSTTENIIGTLESNYPQISNAVITIVETAPQSAHGPPLPPKIYTVPITNKIYHIPIRTHANNTPIPSQTTNVGFENDASSATYVNVNTKFVSVPTNNPSINSVLNDAEPLTDASGTTADESWSGGRVTESLITSAVTSEDQVTHVKELAAQTYSRATKFDSTTISSGEHKPHGGIAPSSTVKTSGNGNEHQVSESEETEILSDDITTVETFSETPETTEPSASENKENENSTEDTINEVPPTTEETVEPPSHEFANNESIADSDTKTSIELTLPSQITEPTVSLPSEQDPIKTDLPGTIPDSQSTRGPSPQNPSDDNLIGSNRTDATRQNLTLTASSSSEGHDTLVSSTSSPPSSQFTSSEAFFTETVPDEFTNLVEIPNELHSLSTDYPMEEIATEQNERADVDESSAVESGNETMIANEIAEDSNNDTLVSGEIEREQKADIVSSGHDRTLKLPITHVLTEEDTREIRFKNDGEAKSEIQENNTVLEEDGSESNIKNYATHNEFDHDSNTTGSQTSAALSTNSRKGDFTEATNISENNDASEKRLNRKDPDRLLRGTMRGRDSGMVASHSSLYPTHRFRKFPW